MQATMQPTAESYTADVPLAGQQVLVLPHIHQGLFQVT